MNQKLIAILSVFAAIVVLEIVAAILGWRKKPGATRPLLGLAAFQVTLPTILIILGNLFPPGSSPDALNIGPYFFILIAFVPWIELLLSAIGLVTAIVVIVSLFRNDEEPNPEETQPSSACDSQPCGFRTHER